MMLSQFVIDLSNDHGCDREAVTTISESSKFSGVRAYFNRPVCVASPSNNHTPSFVESKIVVVV